MADYQQRNYTREDPRLSRQNSSQQSPGRSARKSPLRGAPGNSANKEDWDVQQGSYNHAQALQNAYQSLNYTNPTAQQYPQQTYYTGYQSYTYNPYENYQAMQAQYVNPNPGVVREPGPPGEEYPQTSWTSSNPTTAANYNNASNNNAQAPPVPQPQQDFNNTNPAPTTATYKKKDDGVAEEKNKHLASLVKERETYEERVHSLKKKLKLLIDQKDSLLSKGSPDRESLRIVKENTKLQLEIQNKIKDSSNVIDILSDLIGDKKKYNKVEEKVKEVSSREESYKKDEKVNYKHYDPEVHWCRMCDVFPQSAKELLLHLHSKSHQEMVQEENPWHKLPPEPKFPTYEGAPIKRLSIKGLQFFVASTAWYCRLCDTWIGDLHCASQHLMSVTHSQNYTNFVEQNPHWEAEWLKDREKAVDRVKRKSGSDSEDKKKRKVKDEKYSPNSALGKEKKKKKRSKKRKKHSSDESSSSSSSSSSSEDEKEDRSKSIRVAMRNKMKLLSEGVDGKWEILEKLVEEERRRQGVSTKNESKSSHNNAAAPTSTTKDNDPSAVNQWVSIKEQSQDKDKYILDNLKEKLKLKHEAEKAKLIAEQEAARRHAEKEIVERKQREAAELQERLAREEEEKKHREKMSMKVKEVKMNRREHYRKQSTSASPERRRRRSRSPSYERRRNGRSPHHERSPPRRHNRDRSARDRSRERENRERSRSRDRGRSQERGRSREKDREREVRDEKKAQLNKKLPFIGRMPLFKGAKGKKQEEEPQKKEIQKEEYDAPRKTRFQPGNLARAFIPQPEVVCFPQLSSYPPIPPPPPPLSHRTPAAPKIKVPNAPPPPKIIDHKKESPKLGVEEVVVENEIENEEVSAEAEPSAFVEEAMVAEVPYADDAVAETNAAEAAGNAEEYMLYEDASNSMYPYGNMDYNLMYQSQNATYNYMQTPVEEPVAPEIPKAHTMPLEPPPLPPDDPNEDLAMLGLSSDDLAVQQMF